MMALPLLTEAGSRPGGRGTFLCFAKETYPKERRPYCLRPFAALRATCGARSRGGAVELTARVALRSDNPGESVHEAGVSCGTPARPAPCAPRRIQKGGETIRVFASLDLAFAALRACASQCRAVRPFYPKAKAERSDGPTWAPARVAVPRSAVQRVRMRAEGHACFVI